MLTQLNPTILVKDLSGDVIEAFFIESVTDNGKTEDYFVGNCVKDGAFCKISVNIVREFRHAGSVLICGGNKEEPVLERDYEREIYEINTTIHEIKKIVDMEFNRAGSRTPIIAALHQIKQITDKY